MSTMHQRDAANWKTSLVLAVMDGKPQRDADEKPFRSLAANRDHRTQRDADTAACLFSTQFERLKNEY